MTRAQKVRAALDVLQPPPRLREVYKKEIERSVDNIERNVRFHEALKTPRKKLERHIKTLRRTRVSLPYPDDAFAEILTRRITQFEKLVAPPEWLEEPKPRAAKRKPPQRDAYRQRIAVVEAEGLLINFHHTPKLTRRADWHRLSAIFYGDPRIDLFNHMRWCRDLG